MESVKFLLLLLQSAVLFSPLMSSCLARDFYVGGKDGWVKSPCETFNHWAKRQRFQINDRLVFRYKKGEDSVLVVKKESYDSCNTTEPIEKVDDGGGGESVFRFDRSGSFYYISGERGHCRKGQKLVVVVLADRKKERPSVPSPASWIAPGPAEAGAPAESPGGSSTSSSSGSGLVASVGVVVVIASIFVSLF